MAWEKCWQKRQKTTQAMSAQIWNRTIKLKKILRCCNVAGWILIVDHLHKNMLDGSIFWNMTSDIYNISIFISSFDFRFEINICADCFNVLSF